MLLWTSLLPTPVQSTHKCLWINQGVYSLECKLQEGKDLCLSCSLLRGWHLAQCLASVQ